MTFVLFVLLRDSFFFQKWDARRDTRSGPTFPLVTLGQTVFSFIKKLNIHFFNTRDVPDSSLGPSTTKPSGRFPFA